MTASRGARVYRGAPRAPQRVADTTQAPVEGGVECPVCGAIVKPRVGGTPTSHKPGGSTAKWGAKGVQPNCTGGHDPRLVADEDRLWKAVCPYHVPRGAADAKVVARNRCVPCKRGIK